MKKILFGVVFLSCVIFSTEKSVAGLIEVSLVPSTNKIYLGDNLSVDINISGLQSDGMDNLLGAWSMDIYYDTSLFVPLVVPPSNWDGNLGDVTAGETISDVDISTPGVISLFEVSLLEADPISCIFCIAPYLEDLQSNSVGDYLDSFTLATIDFSAPLGSGFSDPVTSLWSNNIVLSDAFGMDLSVTNAIRHLPVTIKVSEPAAIFLFSLGLLGIYQLSRRSMITS